MTMLVGLAELTVRHEDARSMLGNVLVTKQTGPEGRRVSKLLITLAPNIQKELYLAVLLDRSISRPVYRDVAVFADL